MFSAIIERRFNAAKILLQAGVDVNKGDKHNTSPLYAAAQDGELELVNLLLEHGADPHHATNEGW